jgi:hypothetical protein
MDEHDQIMELDSEMLVALAIVELVLAEGVTPEIWGRRPAATASWAGGKYIKTSPFPDLAPSYRRRRRRSISAPRVSGESVAGSGMGTTDILPLDSRPLESHNPVLIQGSSMLLKLP